MEGMGFPVVATRCTAGVACVDGVSVTAQGALKVRLVGDYANKGVDVDYFVFGDPQSTTEGTGHVILRRASDGIVTFDSGRDYLRILSHHEVPYGFTGVLQAPADRSAGVVVLSPARADGYRYTPTSGSGGVLDQAWGVQSYQTVQGGIFVGEASWLDSFPWWGAWPGMPTEQSQVVGPSRIWIVDLSGY